MALKSTMEIVKAACAADPTINAAQTKGALAELKRGISRICDTHRDAYRDCRVKTYPEERTPEMVFFKPEIVLLLRCVREIVVKEIYRDVKAHHVPDIKARQERKRKGDDEKLETALFDKLLYTEADEREEYHAVHPHGIVPVNDVVRRHGVAGREDQDAEPGRFLGFFEVIPHRQAHRAGL